MIPLIMCSMKYETDNSSTIEMKEEEDEEERTKSMAVNTRHSTKNNIAFYS